MAVCLDLDAKSEVKLTVAGTERGLGRSFDKYTYVFKAKR